MTVQSLLVPFHLSVGNKRMMELLIKSGSDVDEYHCGQTALHSSFRSTRDMQMLLDFGANINAKNYDGETLLHICAKHGETTSFRFALDRGADPTIKDSQGNTVLHYLSMQFMITDDTLTTIWIASFAINSVDVNATNSDGNTALHLAVSTGRHQLALFLIDHGADVRIRNRYGGACVHDCDLDNAYEVIKNYIDF